jgi:predicted RNA binding protein with dsRBD fold (UPF0201 family)
MKTIYLNIGLNVNNTEPHNQVNRALSELLHLGEVKQIRIKDDSIYEKLNIKERALIVKMETHLSQEQIHSDLEDVSKNLNQDSIAFEYEDEGQLAFNPDYNLPKYNFNYKYFAKF